MEWNDLGALRAKLTAFDGRGPWRPGGSRSRGRRRAFGRVVFLASVAVLLTCGRPEVSAPDASSRPDAEATFDGGVTDGGAGLDGAAPDACADCGGPRCGDGTLDPGELCDDGNTSDTDACMTSCQTPAPLTETVGPVFMQPAPHRPVLALYIVSPGGDLQAELAVDRMGSPGGAGELAFDPYPDASNIAIVRVFGPDEDLVHWHHQRQDPGNAAPRILASESEPPPSEFGFDGAGNMQGYRISLRAPGVYQVRVATNSLKTAVRLRLPAGVGHGLSQQNGAFAWPACLGWCTPVAASSRWVFLPRHRTAPLFVDLSVAAAGSVLPTLTREGEGAPLSPITLGETQRFVVAPGSADDGEIWRVDFPASDRPSHFHASGLPFILCDSAASAAAIHASVERVASGPHAGTLVFHRFQREILELLPQLLDPARAGDEARTAALDGPDVRAWPTRPECAGADTGPSRPSADETWRRLDLLHSYDSPLKAVRWYLSSASVGGDGSVTYGAGAPMLVRDPNDHWSGAVGLPLLERQLCRHASDCVAGGACGADGLCEAPFDPARNRWDVLRGVRYRTRDGAGYGPAFTGLALPSAGAQQLMLASTLVHPCNPWGPPSDGAPLPAPELAVRGLAQGLADLLVVGEDERQLPIGDTDPYPGSAAFQLAQFTRAFAAAGPVLAAHRLDATLGAPLAAAVQRVWAEGLRRVVDRYEPAYLVSTMNQSSHILLGTEELAHGAVGLPFARLYRQLAREYAGRFAAGASPSGWLPEASGPSPSYAGMQHWHMAQYLGLTARDPEGEDPAMRAALAASYRFFGWMTAVEPDGQRTSAFNFSHRIGIGFELEQWQGARGLAETIPEVAVWSAWAFPQSGAAVDAALSSLRSLAGGFGGSVAAIPRLSLGGVADVALSLDSTRRPALALLPAVAPGSSETLLPSPDSGAAPEFLAIRRPAYAAALYFGHPAPSSVYAAHWPVTRAVPMTRGGVVIEDVDPRTEAPPFGGATTPHTIDLYEPSPMVGGGLSMFATPSYGSGLIATNWSPLSHHGLVAVLSEGGVLRRFWEDYESVTADRMAAGPGGDCARRFPEAEHRALPGGFSVYGRLEGEQGLCVARHYDFDADRIRVEVVLEREAAPSGATMARLFENVPIPTCTRETCDDLTGALGNLNRKSRGASIEAVASAPSPTFRIRDRDGRGFDVVLEGPRVTAVRPHGLRYSYYGAELQIGRIELDLDVPSAVGARTRVRYALVPAS